jgi:hypothetical protein
MGSEVARLMRRIEEEYEAAQRGLTGLAQGNAQHAFIAARMQAVDGCRQQLTEQVGEPEATRLVCETYVRVKEAE